MSDEQEKPADKQSLDEKFRNGRMLALVQRYVDQLAAEFDTVQIFVTKFDPQAEVTHGLKLGAGNWFARVGYCRDWIQAVDNMAGAPEVSEIEEDEDDE